MSAVWERSGIYRLVVALLSVVGVVMQEGGTIPFPTLPPAVKMVFDIGSHGTVLGYIG